MAGTSSWPQRRRRRWRGGSESNTRLQGRKSGRDRTRSGAKHRHCPNRPRRCWCSGLRCSSCSRSLHRLRRSWRSNRHRWSCLARCWCHRCCWHSRCCCSRCCRSSRFRSKLHSSRCHWCRRCRSTPRPSFRRSRRLPAMRPCCRRSRTTSPRSHTSQEQAQGARPTAPERASWLNFLAQYGSVSPWSRPRVPPGRHADACVETSSSSRPFRRTEPRYFDALSRSPLRAG